MSNVELNMTGGPRGICPGSHAGTLRRLGPACCFLAVLVAGPTFDEGPARAQTPDPRAKAKELLLEGARFMDERRYDKARDSFEEAYRLVPSPKILFNLGVTYLSLARYADALTSFEGFVQQDPDAPLSKLATARGHITELRAKVATVELKSDRASATVSIDGRSYGTVTFDRDLIIDPGHHELRAAVADKSVAETFTLQAGDKRTVNLIFDGPPGATVAPGTPPSSPGAAGASSGGLQAPAPRSEPPPLLGSDAAATASASPVERPYYRRPWVWIAAGGVVAATAVILAVSLSGTEYPRANATIDGP